MLSNREVASLILLGLFLAFALTIPSVRKALRPLAVTFFTPRIVLPLLAYAGFIVLIVFAGAQVRMWEPSLLKDTLVWSLVSGIVLFFKFDEASKEGFVGRRVRAALSAAVFVEFYLNLISFWLIWELLVQATASALLVFAVVAEFDAKTKGIARAARVLLALIGGGLLIATAFELFRTIGTLEPADMARSFLLPLWLTAASLIFIYVLALYANYELAFMRLDRMAKTRRARWRSKLALVVGLNVRNPDVHHFGGGWLTELASAATWGDALRKVREWRTWRSSAVAAKQREADALVLYADIQGTDDEGRQLDRREFAETTDALEWLSVCQMGWYRNRTKGRYPRDLLKIFQPGFTRGLPDDHGITMKVRKDGQAWFAWRRTVTGWCFGIGANGPSPNQWFYEGPEPPHGYPGSDPAWGNRPFERGPNWESDA